MSKRPTDLLNLNFFLYVSNICYNTHIYQTAKHVKNVWYRWMYEFGWFMLFQVLHCVLLQFSMSEEGLENTPKIVYSTHYDMGRIG